MLLSTQNEDLLKMFGFEKAVTILKNAGYDAYDMSLFQMFTEADTCPLNKPDYRRRAQEMRAFADAIGLPCNQAHAPFASSQGDEKDEWRFETIVRSMEIASILGAKCIVVHPVQHLPYMQEKQTLWDMNIAFYKRLIPYCEQFGIKVALENMWQYNHKTQHIADSVCSRPEEFLRYLETLHSPWLVACLDIGHAALTDEDIPTFIRTLGKKHLQALHVHDVDFKNDNHTLPYTMNIEWAAVLDALAEIGYEGDLTFEADVFIRKLPAPLVETGVKFMADVGRYMVDTVQAKM
ncbi:MAG: sugar phosphate isomerase/epimerase [Clostridia bacterium]|nr:sugar phosphate isomerase/epimerase [Clostridia bacterium]